MKIVDYDKDISLFYMKLQNTHNEMNMKTKLNPTSGGGYNNTFYII